ARLSVAEDAALLRLRLGADRRHQLVDLGLERGELGAVLVHLALRLGAEARALLEIPLDAVVPLAHRLLHRRARVLADDEQESREVGGLIGERRGQAFALVAEVEDVLDRFVENVLAAVLLGGVLRLGGEDGHRQRRGGYPQPRPQPAQHHATSRPRILVAISRAISRVRGWSSARAPSASLAMLACAPSSASTGAFCAASPTPRPPVTPPPPRLA